MSEFERAEKAEADAARFSAELQAAREHNAETEMLLLAANTTIREQAEQIRQKDEVIVGLSKKLEAACAALNDTKAGLGRALTYEDLRSGVLRRHVKTFTYFPTAHINDVFFRCSTLNRTALTTLGSAHA